MKKYIRIPAFLSAFMLLAGSLTGCKESDAEKDEGKTPSISYAQSLDPEALGQQISSAYMGEKVAFIGNDMGDVNQVWFNDQKALLNPVYVTSTSIIVDIPNVISSNVTDKVRFVTSKGNETEFDFKVLVPAPRVESFSNEWASPGDEITLKGDYFVDDDEYPIQIKFPGGAVVDRDDLLSIKRNAITMRVPAGADKEGFVTVESRYGLGCSNFVFRDTRSMLIDWDGVHRQAIALTNGWRDGSKLTTNSFDGIPPVDGNYLCFNGVKATRDDMGEDNFSFNHWSVYDGEGHTPGLDPGSLFPTDEWPSWALKFELFVPESNPWTICSLNVLFTPASINNDNTYIYSDDAPYPYPRGMFTPWMDAPGNAYTTGGKWVTVTMPLKDFVYTRYLKTCSWKMDADSFKGLSMIVAWGPESELTSQPLVIAIDNIRFAPLEETIPEEYLPAK